MRSRRLIFTEQNEIIAYDSIVGVETDTVQTGIGEYRFLHQMVATLLGGGAVVVCSEQMRDPSDQEYDRMEERMTTLGVDLLTPPDDANTWRDREWRANE